MKKRYRMKRAASGAMHVGSRMVVYRLSRGDVPEDTHPAVLAKLVRMGLAVPAPPKKEEPDESAE